MFAAKANTPSAHYPTTNLEMCLRLTFPKDTSTEISLTTRPSAKLKLGD